MDVQMHETHDTTSQPREVAVVLGRVPSLSLRELEGALVRRGSTITDLNVASGVAIVKADPTPDETWFHSLGGATKFGAVAARIPVGNPIRLTDAIVAAAEGVETVGVSVIGVPMTPAQLAAEVKQRADSVKRYVLPRTGTVLTAAESKALVGKRSGRELFVYRTKEEDIVLAIEAAQDIDAFTERDRNAPVNDPVRGMLPTKLARMMVNIALGLADRNAWRPVLLDPFVGTGRVLMEGALLGAHVIGADKDPAAARATNDNLAWLARTHRLDAASMADAATAIPVERIAGLVSPGTVDAIVTEPFLGPPQRQPLIPAQRDELFRELTPLYHALFQAGQKLLKSQAGVVVVFPTVGEVSLLDRLVDRLPGMGYHVLDSIRVARPDHIISRTIGIIERKK
ncbi:MAG: TRM11 family SAM-dependent methyltransferase [Patescibacteria group bacterium]|jgi:tRNA G10  N-methylase Trm11